MAWTCIDHMRWAWYVCGEYGEYVTNAMFRWWKWMVDAMYTWCPCDNVMCHAMK